MGRSCFLKVLLVKYPLPPLHSTTLLNLLKPLHRCKASSCPLCLGLVWIVFQTAHIFNIFSATTRKLTARCPFTPFSALPTAPALPSNEQGYCIQHLPRLRFLTAPLPQVDHALVLEGWVQLHVHGTLVEDPLHLCSALP